RCHEGQINDRDVDGRNADGETVQLACQLRQNQTYSSGSTGAGRDHALGCGASATQVRVVDIGQDLAVRVGVNGGHQTSFQTQLVVQRLDQGGQAVGRAGSVGNDGIRSFQYVMVHTINDGGVDILAARSGDDHFLGATLQVSRSLFLTGEEAGALQHHVHVQLAPRQSRWVAIGQYADFVAVDHHVVALDFHLAGETAVGAVVLRQMGVGLGVAQVIDGHDLDVVLFAAFVMSTQNVAANTSVTVDRHANRHF